MADTTREEQIAEFVDAMTIAYSLLPWQSDLLRRTLLHRQRQPMMDAQALHRSAATLFHKQLSDEQIALYISLSDGEYTIGDTPKPSARDRNSDD